MNDAIPVAKLRAPINDAAEGSGGEDRMTQRRADRPQRIDTAAPREIHMISRANDQHIVLEAIHSPNGFRQQPQRAGATAGRRGIDQMQHSHWGLNLVPISSGVHA